MGKSGVSSNEGTNNVRNLWANVILGQGGYSFPHTHGMGDTLWTGVYYPKGLEDIENLEVSSLLAQPEQIIEKDNNSLLGRK